MACSVLFSPRRWTAVLFVFSLAGCQQDGITTYSVPREVEESNKIRFLGAIFPREKETWFVKVDGAEDRVTEQAKEFTAFLNSLQFDKDGQPIRWTKPDGWREGPKPTPGSFTYAGFLVGDPTSPLNLTVTKLGPLGDGENTLLGNVNRWRGQIGLPKWTEEDLKKETTQVPLAGVQATLVDFIGKTSPKRPPKMPPLERPRPPVEEAGPKYKAPEGWTRVAPTISDMLLKFTLKTEDGIAAVSFSLMKQQELLGNVNRWRGELSLPPIDQAEVAKSVASIDLPLGKGDYVDLSNDAKRMLALIIPRGNSAGVFKITGDKKVVEKQKSAFEAFMKSVQLD